MMGNFSQYPGFDVLLGRVGVLFFTKDKAGRYTYVNDATCQLFRASASDIVGRDDSHFLDMRYLQGALLNNRRVLEEGEDVQAEERLVLRDSGREHLFWVIKTPIYDEHGNITGLCGMATDITGRDRVLGGLIEHQPLFNVILANIKASVYMKARDGRYLHANSRVEEVYGRSQVDIVGKTDEQLLDQESAQRLQAFDRRVFDSGERQSGQEQILGADGEVHYFWSVKVPLELPGLPLALFGFSIEITELVRLMEHSECQRIVDERTGLLSRYGFESTLQDELAHVKRSEGSLALLLVDFDRFGNVNTSLGEDAGNEVILESARRLCQADWLKAPVARLSGAVFILVFKEANSPEDLMWVAERLRSLCGEPYQVSGQTLHLRSSVGVSVYPDDGDCVQSLMECAESAARHAKGLGGDRIHFYSPALVETITDRIHMEQDLRKALDENQFELYYQPKINLHTGRSDSVEALVRWNSPEHGFVSPGRFIPMMEQLGLILPLGDWVIEAACRQLARWAEQGLEHISIAVNLSPAQLDSVALVSRVGALLELYGVSGSRLAMEVTESMMMNDPEETIARLEVLKSLGVRLSIDDFGTGFSSMSYLKRLPVDEVKLDRSFIVRVVDDQQDRDLCSGIIALAHNLGLETVAEGVEEADQLDVLRKCGCDIIQGYYYSRPLPVGEITPYLLDQRGLDRVSAAPY